jgi:hypothetical protein
MKMILEVTYPDDLYQADVLKHIICGVRTEAEDLEPGSPFKYGVVKTVIKRVPKSIWKKFIKP